MAMIQQLRIHDQTIEYHLTYRNQKNLVLKFREGQTFLSVPYDCPLWMIQQFLYKNSAKMIQCQTNYQLYKKICLDEAQKWILVFDQLLMIELSPTPIRTKLLPGKILIYNPGDKEALTRKVYSFLGQQYKNWFLNRTLEWAKVLGVEFKNMNLKIMVSKWGVCYPESQKIIYNIKLIHYKPEIIDYVIVHELTHLKHPNHSPSFWHSVKEYLPNYLELKNSLKAYK